MRSPATAKHCQLPDPKVAQLGDRLAQRQRFSFPARPVSTTGWLCEKSHATQQLLQKGDSSKAQAKHSSRTQDIPHLLGVVLCLRRSALGTRRRFLLFLVLLPVGFVVLLLLVHFLVPFLLFATHAVHCVLKRLKADRKRRA